jgi:hypothetical protein
LLPLYVFTIGFGLTGGLFEKANDAPVNAASCVLACCCADLRVVLMLPLPFVSLGFNSAVIIASMNGFRGHDEIANKSVTSIETSIGGVDHEITMDIVGSWMNELK